MFIFVIFDAEQLTQKVRKSGACHSEVFQSQSSLCSLQYQVKGSYHTRQRTHTEYWTQYDLIRVRELHRLLESQSILYDGY